MQLPWNSIKQNKPAIFDWLVFSISLLLGIIFPSLKELITSPAFGSWMLAGLLLYVAGLWLKHRPVYQRLAMSGIERKGIPYILLLIIGHWLIMISVIIFTEGLTRQIFGLPPVPKDQPVSGTSIFVGIVASLFITWLAFRPGRNKSRKLLSEKYLLGRELAADILLISGVGILSFIFWEKTLVGMLAHMATDSIGDICLLFILLCVTYLLVYLPLRYLYLIEDHYSRKVWRRLLLIFILILVRGLFEALRF